ncbi:MAG TPA: glycosyltransferase family 2 protein [Pyrinomonadaceae bacterium]|nr:glycosyltransferase family 2 protein [Pyrinomonadaceae bacterium]
MKADLSIVIVNWNGGDLLRACVESIAAAPPGVPFEIVVVDNASTDDSIARLRSVDFSAGRSDAALRIVENAENVGFSRANNQAIRSSDAPFVFVLNPDTEVRAGAIDALLATLRSDERIGAVGPRLLNTDGTLQVSVSRNPLTAWVILVTGLRLYKLLPKRMRGELLLAEHWDHARRRSVNFLNGAAIMAKREMIDKVGALEERFHMYGEDVEWCLRIVRAGWLLVFEPSAEVVHHGGQSSIKRWDSLERDLKVVDGHLRFQEHCLPRWHVASNILASSLVASIAHVWRGVRGRPTLETKRMLELYMKHLRGLLRSG